MTFNAWVTFNVDAQKEKEMGDMMKATETRMQEHIKAKSESTKKLLSSTIGATDTGLVHQMFQAWLEALRLAKEEVKMAETLNAEKNKFKSFGARGKTSGMSAAERQVYFQDMGTVIWA